MGVVADMDVIEAAVSAGLTDASVAWPNRQFTPPEKTGSPTEPASWYSYAAEYDEDGTEATDLGGGELRRGVVILGCWVEPQAGERRVHEMVDAARAVFASASTDLISFLPPEVEVIGLGETNGIWYGWAVLHPFIAQN